MSQHHYVSALVRLKVAGLLMSDPDKLIVVIVCAGKQKQPAARLNAE